MSKRILLCDDDVHILRAAEYKLHRAGFEVDCAYDGQEGWEAIQRCPPDLVVTDCQMPRMSGFELCERIRATPALQQVPLVMLTAKGYELTLEEVAARWNVEALVTKPFSPRELLRTIETALGAGPRQAADPRPAALAGGAPSAREAGR